MWGPARAVLWILYKSRKSFRLQKQAQKLQSVLDSTPMRLLLQVQVRMQQLRAHPNLQARLNPVSAPGMSHGHGAGC